MENKKNIRKKMFAFGVSIMMIGMLTACSQRNSVKDEIENIKDEKETVSNEKENIYTYDNEDVFGNKIKKTKIYSDKLIVTFSEHTFSEIKQVTCYGADFNVIEEQAEFSLNGTKLTIETKNADKVSGLHIEANDDFSFDIRYLDSDSYAMLINFWATEVGYITEGDKDTYYTKEEKEEQEEKEHKLEEEQAAIYHKLLGEWENESGTVRIDFLEDDLERRLIVSKFEDDEWVEVENTDIASMKEKVSFESLEISLYDNPHWGCVYHFYLLDDGTGMTCHYSDEKFIRK